MSVQRLYIYRWGATNACALTGEKDHSRLPAPLPPGRWQFRMQTSRRQTEDHLYGFAEELAVTQIAAKGFCLFTGSSKLLDARIAVKASSPGKAHGYRATILIKNAHRQLQKVVK
jgi:hypothetical protein